MGELRIGIIKETAAGERRVALVPESVKKLAGRAMSVQVQAGAGDRASFSDQEYRDAGATVLGSAEEVLSACDVVVQVARASEATLAALRSGSVLISLFHPLAAPALTRSAAAKKIDVFALDMIPRTTLAQAMDVLSSQANLAGYWAVVAAAARLPKIFPMLMTAAGTISPARALIMGTGVAGLQAIGTAKRLGAVVEATDVRPETKEQVESLGAKFLMVAGADVATGSGGYASEQSDEYKKKQAEMIALAVSRADVVITTALIPGRTAPKLMSAEHVRSMRKGSVIVDLAAEQGGNVTGSEPGREVCIDGVTVIGAQSAPSNVAFHASQAFSRNIEKLLTHLTQDAKLKYDLSDEITRGALIVQNGDIVHAAAKDAAAKEGV